MNHLPVASQRVVRAAAKMGLAIEIQQFPEGTKTSADAAAAAGCPLSAIAKSLVFVVEGDGIDEPVVAVLSGDQRLDPSKLAAAAGAPSSRRASLEEVRKATGFAAGGTAVFGLANPIRIFADHQIKRNDPIWSAAGTPDTIYPIALGDFERYVDPIWADLAE
ncbi:MAG: YbaK/EbsC family protein [Acidimicrobiia bacterium]|nr:YbaK/EbsC family protein [Acidimicrobiia bacterium]